MEILKIIILKDMENIYGQMAENTMVNGLIIKCMEKVYINGQMEECILVI
jgi:hypothetical protein